MTDNVRLIARSHGLPVHWMSKIPLNSFWALRRTTGGRKIIHYLAQTSCAATDLAGFEFFFGVQRQLDHALEQLIGG